VETRPRPAPVCKPPIVKDLGRRALALAPLALAALLGGCFKSSGGGALPDAQLCNAVPYGNAFVQAMDSGNATEPAATGGALMDGSYYPSSNCAVDPVAGILVVSSTSTTGGSMQTASLTNAGYFLSESTSYLINDTSLQIRVDCIVPDTVGLLGSAAQISYSATPTEIQLYASGACGSHIDVYDSP
jgi:hypothetical protein